MTLIQIQACALQAMPGLCIGPLHRYFWNHHYQGSKDNTVSLVKILVEGFFFLDLMSSCLPPWPGKKFDPLIKVGWTTLRFFFLPLFRLLLKYKTCSLPYTKVVFLPLDTDLVLLMKNSDVKQTAFLFSEECSFSE